MSQHDPFYPKPNTKLNAERAAAQLNFRDGMRDIWIVCDRRPSAGRKRWCVLRAPVVGDPISKVVAGTCDADCQYEEAGTVLSLIGRTTTAHAAVVSTTGEVFWRLGLRACWKNSAGQSMVPGHGH